MMLVTRGLTRSLLSLQFGIFDSYEWKKLQVFFLLHVLLLFGAVSALLALRAALADSAGSSGLAIFMALEPAGPLAGRLDSLTLVLREIFYYSYDRTIRYPEV